MKKMSNDSTGRVNKNFINCKYLHAIKEIVLESSFSMQLELMLGPSRFC